MLAREKNKKFASKDRMQDIATLKRSTETNKEQSFYDLSPLRGHKTRRSPPLRNRFALLWDEGEG